MCSGYCNVVARVFWVVTSTLLECYCCCYAVASVFRVLPCGWCGVLGGYYGVTRVFSLGSCLLTKRPPKAHPKITLHFFVSITNFPFNVFLKRLWILNDRKSLIISPCPTGNGPSCCWWRSGSPPVQSISFYFGLPGCTGQDGPHPPCKWKVIRLKTRKSHVKF